MTRAVAAAQIRDGGAAVAAKTLDAGQLTATLVSAPISELKCPKGPTAAVAHPAADATRVLGQRLSPAEEGKSAAKMATREFSLQGLDDEWRVSDERPQGPPERGKHCKHVAQQLHISWLFIALSQ